MSNLAEHADRELRLAGFTPDADNDSDYGPMVYNNVMAMIEAFRSGGHSGFSAMMTLDIFNALARRKTLTPITSAPEEWMDRTEESGYPFWQNKRNPSCFSEDGGNTWYDLDDPDAKV